MATVPTTWILVADSARARIFEYQGPDSALKPVAGGVLEDARKQPSELMSDKPGRVFNSGSSGRSAMDYRTDPQTVEKERFVSDLAAFFDAHHNDYERLIVTAAPQTLGRLRKELSARVQQTIMAEIDKDLSKTDPAELPQHLKDVILFH